jgi:hypothetical protein
MVYVTMPVVMILSGTRTSTLQMHALQRGGSSKGGSSSSSRERCPHSGDYAQFALHVRTYAWYDLYIYASTLLYPVTGCDYCMHGAAAGGHSRRVCADKRGVSQQHNSELTTVGKWGIPPRKEQAELLQHHVHVVWG